LTKKLQTNAPEGPQAQRGRHWSVVREWWYRRWQLFGAFRFTELTALPVGEMLEKCNPTGIA
jgi:hypothetical protein